LHAHHPQFQTALRPSLRAQRSNPALKRRKESWIASSLSLLAMTTRHTSAFSRRHASELCENLRPGGRGERRMPNAPAASCAKVESTRVVTTGPPDQPGAPARNGFNGFLRALPGDRLVVTVACGLTFCPRPVGPTNLRQLDASAGASGPHDFSVRVSISRLCAVRSLTGLRLPCEQLQRPTLPRPPHPAPSFVTIAKRPSV
jgi:hypothetical protein